MAVKPEVQAFLDLLAQVDAEPAELTPEVARESYRQLYALVAKPEVASVEDRVVPGPGGDVPVRVYTPEAGTAPRPVLVWFHGGGWVIGDLDTTDNTARALAARSGAVVVSVGYRLAPEHPFPAAVDDAVEVTRWVAEHGEELGADSARLGVGGHSAGANLATVTAQLARAMGGPSIGVQVLACPVVDGSTTDRASWRDNAEGYFLTAAMMQWFAVNYLGDRTDARNNPRFSPLLASDLSGLPPAVVVTAELDPLRDEGNAYADALRAAGVHVDHRCYEGEIHDFYTLDGILPEADEALDHMAAAIAETLR